MLNDKRYCFSSYSLGLRDISRSKQDIQKNQENYDHFMNTYLKYENITMKLQIRISRFYFPKIKKQKKSITTKQN
jgi:hypothetical protein